MKVFSSDLTITDVFVKHQSCPHFTDEETEAPRGNSTPSAGMRQSGPQLQAAQCTFLWID